MVTFILYLLGFLAHAVIIGKTVYGDGRYYVAWLRSVVVDRDIDFTNDYAMLKIEGHKTQLGYPANKYPIGPALLWLIPFATVFSILGGNGLEFPYQLVLGLASLFAVATALVLLFRLLSRWYSHPISILTVVTIALTTNLLFYGSVDVVNSHSVSFFAMIIFLSLLLARHKHWFAIGASLGFLTITRHQDAIAAILLLPFVRSLRPIPFIAGLSLLLLPQLLAWHVLYGAFWQSPYLSGSEGFNFANAKILDVLVSPQNGLLLWTPGILFSFVGLLFCQKPTRTLATLFLAVFCLELIVVASWSTWWQGASFSGRMFVSSLPLVAFGTAEAYRWMRERAKWRDSHFLLAVILPLGFLNIMLIVFFLLKT